VVGMFALARFARNGILALIALLSIAGAAWATDTEHRDYAVFVNGKQAGSSRITMVVQDDGSTYMAGSLDVKVNQLLFKYTLKLETQEWWKDGKLVGLKTNGVENGKQTEVSVAADNNAQLRLRVNGQERAVRADVWTSSYWKLADARFHGKEVPVLEVDTGKEMTGTLELVGAEQKKIGNDLKKCYHFRVKGLASPVDLWFDEFHRLVRQEFVEQGQQTIVELIAIRR
jgi:hypothetical protein